MQLPQGPPPLQVPEGSRGRIVSAQSHSLDQDEADADVESDLRDLAQAELQKRPRTRGCEDRH